MRIKQFYKMQKEGENMGYTEILSRVKFKSRFEDYARFILSKKHYGKNHKYRK